MQKRPRHAKGVFFVEHIKKTYVFLKNAFFCYNFVLSATA